MTPTSLCDVPHRAEKEEEPRLGQAPRGGQGGAAQNTSLTPTISLLTLALHGNSVHLSLRVGAREDRVGR